MQKIDGEALIKELDIEYVKAHLDEPVILDACVHKIKTMSGFSFVILRTGKYLIQSIYEADKCKQSLDDIKVGTYIKVKGYPKQDDRANLGFEIELDSFEILSQPAAD